MANAQPNCELDHVHCVGANQEFNTASRFSHPQAVIQKVLDRAEPGDRIYIKGGIYQHDFELTANKRRPSYLLISRSGRKGAPISIVTIRSARRQLEHDSFCGLWHRLCS